MTNQEAKEACDQQKAVIHRGITYACISKLIYEPQGGGQFKLSLELKDKPTSGRSVIIADPAVVSLAEPAET